MKLTLTTLLLPALMVSARSPVPPSPSFQQSEAKLVGLLEVHDDLIKNIPTKEEVDVPRHDWTVPVMIAKEGYPVETHTVVTEDCYILEMHRIPYGKQSPPQEGVVSPAVYLQHGLLCSSADWVMGIPEKSLGYILADAGYDVWMGNYRGNTYSRNHCDLNPDHDEFWQFSWQENGIYDIPAMIDTILASTMQEKIHYVGHSMGTTGLMVTINERPEYKEKIKMANFLAPVAYVDHMTSPIRLLAPFVDEIEWIAEHLGLGEFFPSNWVMDTLADLFCDEGWLQAICKSVIFLICGFDQEQLNETLLETIVHHTPAGASTKQLIHYAQEVNSGEFAHYDFGKDNEDIYGSSTPPPFSIEAIDIPISLYWGDNDWMAHPTDLLRLVSHLPNIFDNYEVPFPKWNHLDFLWGIDADTLVYPQVVNNMAIIEGKEHQ